VLKTEIKLPIYNDAVKAGMGQFRLTYMSGYVKVSGPEPLLTSVTVCSSIFSHEIPPHFMEPEGSLQCSQQHVTCSSLSATNPAHALTSYLRSILIFSHLRLVRSSNRFPSCFLVKILHAFMFPTRATCSAYLSCLHLIIERTLARIT
jgi:hypothetical protein